MHRFHSVSKTLILLAVALMVAFATAANTVATEQAEPLVASASTLRMYGNSYIEGQLVPSPTPEPSGVLYWQHSLFDAPFEFPMASVTAISSDQPEDASLCPGRFAFSLLNGDMLYGDIVDINAENWTINNRLLGEVRFATSALKEVFFWDDGKACLFQGPGSLANWLPKNDEGRWTDVGGQLQTRAALSTLYRNIQLPQAGQVELEISWQGRPNFVISLGTTDNPESAGEAFRIEVWDSVFVLLRELDTEAEIAVLGDVATYGNRARWRIYFDQTASRVTVYSERGEQLATIQVGRDDNRLGQGIHFENVDGDLRIESLRVFAAGSVADQVVAEGKNYCTLADGSIVVGEIVGIEGSELLVEPEQRIPLENLRTVQYVSHQHTESKEEVAVDVVRLVTRDALRLTGKLLSVQGDGLRITPAYTQTELKIPLENFLGLQAVSPRAAPAAATSRRVARLELADANLPVVLEDATAAEVDGASCLQVRPVGANKGARLLTTASGRIVYHDAEEEKSKATPQRRVAPPNRGLFGAVMNAFAGDQTRGQEAAERVMHLRTGDVVPGTVRAISEEGVVFDSTITGEIRIANTEIKAVEFNALEKVLELDDEKRQRLLTIPRLRKKAPPRHLLVSNDGDFLLGNLISLDEETAIVENRLKEIKIPRRLLSKIIWLHEDEIEGDEEAEAPAEPAAETQPTATANMGLLVQAVQHDGVRLTFNPTECGGGELVGSSPLLGVCLVNLRTVDQILFGAAVQAEQQSLPFHAWRLSHAPLPRVYSEGSGEEGGGENAGMSSELVGKAAPEVALELLNGGMFRIADYRGKVLVLDFWATWCGPCMQAMPQIDEAVNAFDPGKVALVAVNLQESADQIRPTLERLGIEPAVALDIDGVAASRYQATAIPQTVIIDQQGVIRRLYVGSGGNLKEQLTQAIEATLNGSPDEAQTNKAQTEAGPAENSSQ